MVILRHPEDESAALVLADVDEAGLRQRHAVHRLKLRIATKVTGEPLEATRAVDPEELENLLGDAAVDVDCGPSPSGHNLLFVLSVGDDRENVRDVGIALHVIHAVRLTVLRMPIAPDDAAVSSLLACSMWDTVDCTWCHVTHDTIAS